MNQKERTTAGPTITFVSLIEHAEYPPLSFLSLASYINSRTEHTASILNLTEASGHFEETVIEHLSKRPPEWVGFSCFTRNYSRTMKLSAAVKAAIGCRIVVGNVHPSLYPGDFIFNGSPVDNVVIGEGELALADLLDAHRAGKSTCGIPGTATLGQGGNIVIGKKRELISDLSILPPTDYSLIDLEPYVKLRPYFTKGTPLRSFPVHTARGCAFSCEFCAANSVWKCNSGRAVRFRPVQDVVAEISELKKTHRLHGISIGDDSMMTSKSHVLALCRELEKLDIIWSAQGRMDQLDEEMLLAMKRAGCMMLYFGVESGSDRILQRINKRQTTARAIEVFELCKKHGILRSANIMCNHPGETEEDIALTKKLLETIKPDELFTNVMTPYPGTAVFEKFFAGKITAAQYGLYDEPPESIAVHFKMSAHDLNAIKIMDEYQEPVLRSRLPTSVRVAFGNPRYLRNVLLTPDFPVIFLDILRDGLIYLRYFLIHLIPPGARLALIRLRNSIYREITGSLSLKEGSVLKKILDKTIGTPW